MYIYQHKQWPIFSWQEAAIASVLSEVRYRQGRFAGQMQSLGFSLRSRALLATLAEDVVKTSKIEGEHLGTPQVRSSLARRLGLDIAGLVPASRTVDGVVEMTVDATREFARPLNKMRLFAWHALLFPDGRSGLSQIQAGRWRDDAMGPMQVVSGPLGKERVHYQAPDATMISELMTAFFNWFEQQQKYDWVVKAALAHLWFVTIHPFDDGNGRIARAIADLALARSEESGQRFYSMSAQIEIERDMYYTVLERAQKGSLDVTAWLEWFLQCLNRSLVRAEKVLAAILNKDIWWRWLSDKPLHERQRKVLNLLIDGFEGKLTSSKWAKLNKCSQDTAARDIDDLVQRSILVRSASGGRSTSYDLVPLPGSTTT